MTYRWCECLEENGDSKHGLIVFDSRKSSFND